MEHMSHKSKLDDLRNIEASIKDIAGMIENERYCVDILKELKAVRADLKRLDDAILQTHVEHCLTQADKSTDPTVRNKIRQEISSLLEIRAF